MIRLRGLAGAACVALAATLLPAATVGAVQTARAVVNVRGSNHVITFGGSISGVSALQMVASVETVSYGGVGTAVCKINGVGNPPIPGQCLGEQSGTYWSYWRAGPGAGGFSYAGTGAGGASVSDGSVEGWNFGSGPPPFSSFCAVAGCAPPPPPPTAAPAPPPTAAPAAAPTGAANDAGSDAGANADGGSKAGKGSGTSDKKKDDADGGQAAGSDETTSATGDGESGGDGRDSSRAAGRIELRSDDDGSSPWGVIAAGAAVAALGAGGMIIRRRRRATPL